MADGQIRPKTAPRVEVTPAVVTDLIERFRSSGGSYECAARYVGIPVLLLRHWMFLGELVDYYRQNHPDQYERQTAELWLLGDLWGRIEDARVELASEYYERYLGALEDPSQHRVADKWLQNAGRLCADYTPERSPIQHEAERRYLARWSADLWDKYQLAVHRIIGDSANRERHSADLLNSLAATASAASLSGRPYG